MKPWRWILAGLAAALALTAALVVAVPYLVDLPRVQQLVASTASHALGRPVRFAGISVHALPLPAVELRGLEVAEDPRFGTEPFLRIDRGDVRLRLLPLLRGHVEFGDVLLRRPEIALIQHADGHWNIASLGAGRESHGPVARGRGPSGTAAPAALVRRVKIADAVVRYTAPGAGGALAHYRVEDLALTIENRAGRVAFDGSARVRPGDLAVTIADGAVSLGSVRTLGEAPVRAQVRLDGKDVKDLAGTLLGPTPTLGGALHGTLGVDGTVARPHAAGDVEVTGATVTQVSPQCADRKPRTLTVPTVKASVDWAGSRLSARPVTLRVADGDVTFDLLATLDGAAHADLTNITAKQLALERVLVDFLCEGYAVSGKLDMTGRLTAALADVWASLGGDGRIDIGRGKIVGPRALALLSDVTRLGGAVSSLLSADVPTTLFASPLDFDSITATYRITGGVVRTNDLLYTSQPMRVAAAGEYALRTGRLNMDVAVRHARGEVRAQVTGTAASPSIRVSPDALMRQVEPGQVERGLRDLLKRFR